MVFNNREIATILIFITFIIFALYKSEDRQDILSKFMLLIKAIFSKYLLTTIILFSTYMYYEISFLQKITFVDSSMLKESIIWSFGAFLLIVKHREIIRNDNFIKKLLLDNLKFIVLFEFICSMYTFNLFVEIILVFTATVLFMLQAVLENKELDKDEDLTLKVINFLISSLGFIIIIFTLNQFYNNYDEFKTLQNIKSFILPLVLIFLYLPFYYLVILYSKYELIFVMVNFIFNNDNKKLNSYLKRKIFFNSFLNYSKLKTIHPNLYNFNGCQTKLEIDNVYKNNFV